MELDEEYTKCSICVTEFSCDRDNKDPEIRKHLPVLSSSQRCDHWFCHGCILREQLRVAEENNGRIPKWLKCMHCREKTSFNPAEPKYHRLLIGLLARAQAARVKSEEQEETTISAGTKRKTPSETAPEKSMSKVSKETEEGTSKSNDDDDAKKTAAKQGKGGFAAAAAFTLMSLKDDGKVNGRAVAAAGPTRKSLPISATAGLLKKKKKKSPPEKAGAFMTRLYEEDEPQDDRKAKTQQEEEWDNREAKFGFTESQYSHEHARPEDFFEAGSVNYVLAAAFLSKSWSKDKYCFSNWKKDISLVFCDWEFFIGHCDEDPVVASAYNQRQEALAIIGQIRRELELRAEKQNSWDEFYHEIKDVIVKILRNNHQSSWGEDKIETFAKIVLFEFNKSYHFGLLVIREFEMTCNREYKLY